MNNLGHLPVEILSLIGEQLETPYNRLYQCTLVNKHFYTVLNPLLWRTVELYYDEALEKWLNCLGDARDPLLGRHVRELTPFFEGLNDTIFLFLIKQLPLLQKFSIEPESGFTDISIQRLARHCPNLTYLHPMMSSVSQQSIVTLAQHCHQLSTLRLDCCDALCSSDFFAMIVHFPLKYLEVDLQDMTDLNEPSIADKAVLDLAAFDRLTFLEISDSPSSFIERIITLGKDRSGNIPWPQLYHFYISETYTNVTDQQLITFLQSHPKLTTVSLNSNVFTDTALHAIPTLLPKVTSLSLSSNQFSHRAIRRLAYQCPLLMRFSFSDDGMRLKHFPEADGSGVTTRTGATEHVRISSLSSDALQRIRLAPNPDDERNHNHNDHSDDNDDSNDNDQGDDNSDSDDIDDNDGSGDNSGDD
ncbi:unnamed protein product [Absidia cylindrospora]